MAGLAWVRGAGRDRLVRSGAGAPGAWGPWTPNLVTWAAADLIGALLTGRPGARGLGWLAVGRGRAAWDDAPPDPDPSRTALEDEVARVPLRPGADLTFDRATGTVRAAVALPPGLAVGPLREVGLFGGVASSRPGSGVLVNHRVHDRIDVGDGDRLDREVRLVLGDPLLPGARLVVGSLLARWASAAGLTFLGLGEDGGAAAGPTALGAERSRRPLVPGQMRYRPDDHAVEVDVVLGPGEGPAGLAEIGVFGGPATANAGTGWLFARDTVAGDRTTARRFAHRLRLTLVGRTGLTVPDATGHPLDEARGLLVAAGVQAGAITLRETGDEPPDRVVAQRPEAGATVAEATPVALTVTAVPRVAVPDVVGAPAAGAAEALARVGLVAAEPPVERTDAVAPPGTVLAAAPAPGARVPVGTAVTLTVAVAPMVTVPDVRGRPLDRSRLALAERGLSVADPVTQVASDATAGTVVAQDPAPGASVARGSAVALSVAVPRTVAAPSVVGLGLDAARDALAAAGAPLLPPGITAPPGLDIGARTDREVTRGEPTGVVLGQSPAAGSPLALHGTLDVVVAVPAAVVVPDLAGTTLADATARLSAVALRLGRTGTRRSDAAPGTVVAQDPAPATPAQEGDAVAVWVAAGALARVPRLVGLTLDAAREALTAGGLDLAVTAQAPGPRPGEVLAQDPAPDALVAVGTTVGVTVTEGVPSLVGLTLADARAAAAAVGLALREQTRPMGGPPGIVVEQDPPPGAAPPAGGTVVVIVSAPQVAEVPDVRGQRFEDATALLARAGFAVVVGQRPVDADRAGTVVRQDPPAGAQAPLGSTVTVDVAQRPVDAVEVPAVDGLTLDTAKARLAAVGLRIGRVVEQPSRVAPGTIIGQDPPGGTVVAQGSAVALTVAVDGGVVVVPDTRGLAVQDATAVLDRAGLGLAVARTVAAAERPGTVLDQDPPPGVKVAVGTTVSVLVAAPAITVPSLIGLPRDRALAALSRLNLVGSTHTVFSGEPAGTVVAQSPVPGTLVQAGDTVELSIARNLGGHVDPFEHPGGPVLVPHSLGPIGPLRPH